MISYYSYYLELKNRFLLLGYTWACTAISCYVNKNILLFLFFSTNIYNDIYHIKPYFIFTNVTEVFFVYTQLIFFISNQILFVMFFYHLFMFLSYGFYKTEYTKIKYFFKIFVFSWTSSLVILHKVLLPFSLLFFLSFHPNDLVLLNSVSFSFEAKSVEYLEYLTNLYYVCLINWSVLVLTILFINKFSESLQKIKSFRKIFYFTFAILSTLTTPPDVFSQVLLCSCLVIAFETNVFLNLLNNLVRQPVKTYKNTYSKH